MTKKPKLSEKCVCGGKYDPIRIGDTWLYGCQDTVGDDCCVWMVKEEENLWMHDRGPETFTFEEAKQEQIRREKLKAFR